MTPPTRKARLLSLSLPAFLTAPLLALGLSLSPDTAQAALSPKARPSLQGLRLAGEPPVPMLCDRFVRAGLDAIGTPYSWGGDDPADGFDCSGLVLFVYRHTAGLELPRTARAQRGAGRTVARKNLRPGDLVFFATRGRGVTSHVGIYIGQDQFVHAPTRGSKVRVDSMDNRYWNKRFVGARRYLDTPAAGGTLLAASEN
ncbi:C40 family peptidase [Bordetella pertussis]|uniref:C40 family peptidase n=1 Tax=Bordetella pertussis TaxID=520 RepID=UPI00366BB40B